MMSVFPIKVLILLCTIIEMNRFRNECRVALFDDNIITKLIINNNNNNNGYF